jgi:hypothetical protein
MGKYSNLKGKLVKFEVEPEWQQKIDQLKPDMMKLKNADLGELFSGLKDRKSELEGQIRELNTQLEAISQVLIERMETDAIQNFKTSDGTTIFIKDEPYTSTSDKQALFQWIRDTEQEDLFSVHYQTLSAIVKERLESGEELPPGVAVYMKSSIQRRAGKAS